MSKKKLNEIDSKEYTRELAQKRIKEQNLPQFDDVFDLRKIPENVLDAGYVSYIPFLASVSHNSLMYRRHYVAEGIDYLGNIEKAKEELERCLPIKTQYQFNIKEAENGIYIGVLISYIPGNHDTIIEAMKRMGFYKFNRKNKPEFLYDNKCREWEHMTFKPCEQDDVTDEVKEYYQYVYHATPSIFANSILQGGLVPSNKNPEIDYNGPSLFVMKGNTIENEGDVQRIVDDLYYQAKQKGYDNLPRVYTILKIELSKLDDSVRFYLDSDEKQGLFTREKIPAEAISVYAENVSAKDSGLAPEAVR